MKLAYYAGVTVEIALDGDARPIVNITTDPDANKDLGMGDNLTIWLNHGQIHSPDCGHDCVKDCGVSS